MARRNTRDRLIQAAAELMIRKGYQAAGVDEVCRLAGAQKGSFYHFFPAKTDLALAALAFAWSEIQHEVFEAVDTGGDPGLDRLRRFVDAADAFHRRQWAARQVLGSAIGALGQEMAGQDERIRAAVRDVFDAQADYIGRWLDEAARARQISVGDNHQRARGIVALVEGALLVSRVTGRPEGFRETCAQIPAVAGRAPSPPRPTPATAPELA